MSKELTTTEKVQDAELMMHLDNLGLTTKLNDGEKNTFLQIAKAFNLNPFKREIHVSKYGDQMAVITGYEVYIKRAERSGLLDGWGVKIEGSVENNDLTATLTINRKDQSHPFTWEVYYDECVQRTREGKPTKFWEKARFMLKKVAISQGFRLCFSDELGGMPYTADELPQQTEEGTYTEQQSEPKLIFVPIANGSKAFKSGVKAMKDGKTFEEVEAVANGAGLTFGDGEVKTALLDAVEVAA